VHVSAEQECGTDSARAILGNFIHAPATHGASYYHRQIQE